MPNQELTSSWCYTGEKWSAIPCEFLEMREHYAAHAFYTYNNLPEVLSSYLKCKTPGEIEIDAMLAAHHICKSSMSSFYGYLDQFYGHKDSTSMEEDAVEDNLPCLKGGQLLVTEPSDRLPGHSNALAEIAFETVGVEGWYAMRKAPLAAFAFGRSTALVTELGALGTRISPVFEGYTLQHNSESYPVGGGLLECALATKTELWNPTSRQFVNFSPWRKHSLNEAGEDGFGRKPHPRYLHLARRRIVSDMAEHMLCVEPGDEADQAYELPDGTCIYQMRNDCAALAEYMFTPSTVRDNSLTSLVSSDAAFSKWPGVSSAIMNVGFNCDVEVLPLLFQNIVLSGGVAAMDGFVDKVGRDLINERRWKVRDKEGGETLKDSSSLRLKVCAQSKLELPMSTWIGGSMVGNLSSFDSYWISKSEWQEYGHNILDNRLVF